MEKMIEDDHSLLMLDNVIEICHDLENLRLPYVVLNELQILFTPIFYSIFYDTVEQLRHQCHGPNMIRCRLCARWCRKNHGPDTKKCGC